MLQSLKTVLTKYSLSQKVMDPVLSKKVEFLEAKLYPVYDITWFCKAVLKSPF